MPNTTSPSENTLGAVLRDLRPMGRFELPYEFAMLPIVLRSVEFDRLFQVIKRMTK